MIYAGTTTYTRIEELRLISRHYGAFAEQAQAALYQRAWERSGAKAAHDSAAGPLAQGAALRGSNGALVEQITGMGFPIDRAAVACQATFFAGRQKAADRLNIFMP